MCLINASANSEHMAFLTVVSLSAIIRRSKLSVMVLSLIAVFMR